MLDINYASELEIVHEHLCFDNCTLLQMYYKLQRLISEKEEELRQSTEYSDETDYLRLAVARLSYGFAKEEFNTVYNEIKKRGLITTQ